MSLIGKVFLLQALVQEDIMHASQRVKIVRNICLATYATPARANIGFEELAKANISMKSIIKCRSHLNYYKNNIYNN